MFTSYLNAENTHHWWKYHCMAGLQFYNVWLQLLHCYEKTTFFLLWTDPVLLNWRPGVQ